MKRRGSFRTLVSASATLALLASSSAQTATAASASKDPLFRTAAPNGKVARVLLAGDTPQSSRQLSSAGSSVPLLDIHLSAISEDVLERLRDAGLTILDSDFRHARVLGFCASCLTALDAVPEVDTVAPNYGAHTNVGNALSQADASIRADQARSQFGVDGSGIHIGMLSDTFSQNAAGSLNGDGCDRIFEPTSSAVRAELPDVRVVAEPEDFPQGVSFRGIDEGRAMAELIHDLAPGATLSYHTAFTTESIFARGIDALVDCGADIIVDDVIYFAEPMFQDGPVAQAARRSNEAGITFFSAIGNLGPWGVDEQYVDFSPMDDDNSRPNGDDFHVWGNGTRWARIRLPNRCGLRMVLQWNEPFGGSLGPGASSDLDIYACPSDDPLVRCDRGRGGTDSQGCGRGEGGGGNPLEIMDIPGGRREVFIAINHVCGNPDLRFRIVSFALGCNFPSTFEFDEEVFDQSQTYGHPSGAGVAAIGGVFYREIDSGGTEEPPNNQIDVEPFSSSGGDVPIYFTDDGELIEDGPVLRRAPWVSAPDGTNTSFFGLFDAEGDGFLNFFGTSAAAPHAAAVAALILEASPNLTNDEVLDIMRRTAIDIEEPGFDFLGGHGLIDARNAVAEAIARLTASPTPTATATNTATETATPTSTPLPTTPTPCPADCDGDGSVSISELVTAVRISLGAENLSTCPTADTNGDGTVQINELIQAVNAALSGC